MTTPVGESDLNEEMSKLGGVGLFPEGTTSLSRHPWESGITEPETCPVL